jgi:purine-nucleoside phosphorylase
MIKQTAEAVKFLIGQGFTNVETAIVLGTGLTRIIDQSQIIKRVSFTEIPFFVDATVAFHKGELVLANINDSLVLIMQGRFHYYEGYTMQEITFPVRVFKSLGIKQLLLTNASGGINPAFKKEDLVLINDHINMQPDNPLRGLNDPALGNRFVDMSSPYCLRMSASLRQIAASIQVELKEGVYVAVSGPNLETRAEYRFLRTAGADMVGMSTVPEVIVANHVGLACAAISIITDECDPDNLKPVSIEEIIETASKGDEKLARVIVAYLSSTA